MKSRFRLGGVRHAVAVLGIFALVGWNASCANRGGYDRDEEAGQSASSSQSPATLAVVNSQTVLTLRPAAVIRLGIAVEALASRVTRAERTAPAVVLPAADLVNFRNSYISAKAQAEVARAESAVAREEYVRLKGLYAADEEVSRRALEAADGTLQSDQARERAAEQQLSLQADIVGERWGPVVSQWAVGNSAELAGILDQREWFVQVTMPPGMIRAADPPVSISLELPTGRRVAARFVSTMPQVDPRIQGLSYLYRSPAAPGVSAGAALVAQFPAGKPLRGVVVPGTAVVWRTGQAWVYEEQAPSQFVRRRISTDIPAAGGYFQTGGLATETKVVVRGAQSLLSEELLLEGGSIGPDDEDPD